MKRKMLLFTLALPVFFAQSARAQVFSRLMTESHRQSNGVLFTPIDSFDYHYSGGRGGMMDVSPTNIDVVTMPDPMEYSNETAWNFVGDSAYVLYERTQTFDANNNILSNTVQDADGVPMDNTLYTYNASNMVVKMTFQTWNVSVWESHTQHLYTYNSAGKLSLDSIQTWQTLTSSWVTTGLITYYYDAHLNLVNETHDNVTGGVPVHNIQITHTYSSTDQLLTTTRSTWVGSGWVNQNMYTHAYDVMGRPATLLYQTYNSITPAWTNQTLYLYSNYNPSNLPQTVVRQSWDPTGSGMWVNVMQESYMYNGFNQVTYATGVSWNPSSSSFQYAAGDPLDNYSYQTYSPVSVKNVSANGGDAKIYPVPAQNMLHVDLSWAVAQSATISIMDMTGSIVKQWNAPSAEQFNSAVSIHNLAAGVYMIHVNGEKNQIVKQIVVAH